MPRREKHTSSRVAEDKSMLYWANYILVETFYVLHSATANDLLKQKNIYVEKYKVGKKKIALYIFSKLFQ